jgi:hypothetical protein
MGNTKIEEQSDSEILKISNPIWDEIVEGCRNKDWRRYSQFFIDEDRANPNHKKDILNQWENNPILTSLTKDKHFLSILRRENGVVVVWKLGSTAAKGEFLGSLHLTTIDSEIKVMGVGLI